jgi:hypothetical protein
MLSYVMFGDENWALNHWCEADEVMETLLIELMVLAAQGPLNIVHAVEALINGIAGELDDNVVERSLDYANYRISGRSGEHR